MSKAMRHGTVFRLLIGGLGVLMAGPALAQACVQPAERTAFEVRALQSQLMVAALTCNRDNDYNAFVRKFQGELGASYRTIQTHFRRSGGNHQRALDSYITQLANEQSQEGVRAGSLFCPLVTPLFQAAIAQSNAAALAEFAVERNVLNPMSAPACPPTPVRAAATRRPSR
jgi:hypothetical protein